MSDLNHMKSMLEASGTRYAAWGIKEYVDRWGSAVVMDPQGSVLTLGAEDDGPYSEFVFDNKGDLLQATANYCKTTTTHIVTLETA